MLELDFMETVKACCNRNKRILMKKANVISVGCGRQRVGGKDTGLFCIVVGVTAKKHLINLGAKDRVPEEISGVLTDVVVVGKIVAQLNPKQKQRPAPPGVSIGHYSITAGTFGCVVKQLDKRYILSNNHVLAFSNEGNIGDIILQPGSIDGGIKGQDDIGFLYKFVDIMFNDSDIPPTCPIAKLAAGVFNILARHLGRKHRLQAVNTDTFAVINKVDAALVEPLADNVIMEEIVGIGIPTSITAGSVGMAIKKFGRTTQLTKGVVQQTNAMVQVSYGAGKTAIFDEQIITSAMSAGGDSGSVVLKDSGENIIVGLLFAGSEQVTILNEISNVFDALDVYI